MSPAAGEWRRGWPVVVAGMFGIGFGPGLFQNLSSLFTPGMAAEFGWTRGEIATASGVGLLGALLVPLVGRAADRLGVRPVIAGAMLLLGAAYLGMASLTGRLWAFQLLVLLLTLSVPGTSAICYGKLVAARFREHRGLALGVATSGISVTTLLLAPAVGAVIAGRGWRAGFAALAAAAVLGALPLILFLIRRERVAAGGEVAALAGMSGGEARRTGRFWRLAGCGLLVTMATVGLVTQLVPWGLDVGLTGPQAAALLTSYGASQVAGRLAIGVLVDRLAPQRVAAGVAVVSAAAFAGLLWVETPGFPLALALVFAAGLMHGAEFDLLPFFTARLFGLRAYGEVYGTVLMTTLVGTAAGIVGFGRLHDLTGGYAQALGLASGALLLAALGFLSLGEGAPALQAASARPRR